MKPKAFCVELDGQRVLVNQEAQEVAVLDSAGNVIFRDKIQVAASKKILLGLATAADVLEKIAEA